MANSNTKASKKLQQQADRLLARFNDMAGPIGSRDDVTKFEVASISQLKVQLDNLLKNTPPSIKEAKQKIQQMEQVVAQKLQNIIKEIDSLTQALTGLDEDYHAHNALRSLEKQLIDSELSEADKLTQDLTDIHRTFMQDSPPTRPSQPGPMDAPPTRPSKAGPLDSPPDRPSQVGSIIRSFKQFRTDATEAIKKNDKAKLRSSTEKLKNSVRASFGSKK